MYLEPWRKCWRNAIAPQLPKNGLKALRKAILKNSPRVIQHEIFCLRDNKIYGGCAVGYALWKGCHYTAVYDIIQHYNTICEKTDRQLKKLGAHADFFDWFDNNPLEQVLPLLLEEIDLALNLHSHKPSGESA